MVATGAWLETHAGADVDQLDGKDFERCLAVLFERLGYSVTVTQNFDYGADLVVEKDGARVAVQAKRWDQVVGERAVQQVVAGQAYYGCARGIVVTNSSFNNRAKAVAKAASVELWDRLVLADRLDSVGMLAARERLQAPVCTACGTSSVARRGRFGTFYGCAAYALSGCQFKAPYHEYRLRIRTADVASPAPRPLLPPLPPSTPWLPVPATAPPRGPSAWRPPSVHASCPPAATPRPGGLKVALVITFVVLGWLCLFGMVLAALASAPAGQSHLGNAIVGGLLFGAPTLWGTVVLRRWRHPI